MRISTFEVNGREAWGVVQESPFDHNLYIFEPDELEKVFRMVNVPPNTWYRALPAFCPDGWPKTVKQLLETTGALEILARMDRFLTKFLKQSDMALALSTAHRFDSVVIRPPIPQPELIFGLVQNCPFKWRNNPDKKITNFIPQGHQRPIGSLVGHGQVMHGRGGYNVELGVIIGKEGRNIPIEAAAGHIAGYTVVIDALTREIYSEFSDTWREKDIEEEYDWFVGASCSWGGKMADMHCAAGPYLVTPDEVGNPYDLLVYTLQNDMVRDRSHTVGTSQGIERVIHWLSGFMTLKPGDLIHMGTAGTDTVVMPPTMHFGPNDRIQAEIEHIGKISCPMLDIKDLDWRTDATHRKNAQYTPRDSAIETSLVPAVGDYLRNGTEYFVPEQWNLAKTVNFYTCYGNYRNAENVEKLRKTHRVRALASPIRSLGLPESGVILSKRTTGFILGAELAFVISRLASQVRVEEATDYLLGFIPMLAVSDQSFATEIHEPATPQEHGLTQVVYPRWGDGYNIVGPLKPINGFKDKNIRLTVENGTIVDDNTDEYWFDPGQILAQISRHTTLFPGDIITLGRLEKRLKFDSKVNRLKVKVEIEGYTEFTTEIQRK